VFSYLLTSAVDGSTAARRLAYRHSGRFVTPMYALCAIRSVLRRINTQSKQLIRSGSTPNLRLITGILAYRMRFYAIKLGLLFSGTRS